MDKEKERQRWTMIGMLVELHVEETSKKLVPYDFKAIYVAWHVQLIFSDLE